jgi:hypothetical protein
MAANTTRAAAIDVGRSHHAPPSASNVTISGARAVPVPRSVCRAVMAVAPRLGKKLAAKALIAVSVAPKPMPSNPVAVSTIGKASPAVPASVALSANVAMERALQPKPASSTVFRLRRRASVGASSDASTEPANSGRKMLPY